MTWQSSSDILTRDTVHYNQSTISNTESSRNFRGEVDVPWWVNQVDQEARTILGLLNEGQVILTQLIEQGDGAISKNKKVNWRNSYCRNLKH